MALTMVAKRNWDFMPVRSVIIMSVSPSLRSKRLLMFSRCLRAVTPMSSAGMR